MQKDQNNFRLKKHFGAHYMTQIWCPMNIFDIWCLKSAKMSLKNSKKLKNDFFNFFIPKNSFSDQITSINDMQHDIPDFHIFILK